MDAAGLDAGLLLQFGDDTSQRMAVKRVAMQRLGMQHELAAFGFCRRGGDRHFAAELIGRPSFAFADALDLGGMQRIKPQARRQLWPMAGYLPPQDPSSKAVSAVSAAAASTAR